MKCYAVGGSVRDMLLGRPAADRDFVVFGATVEEFLAAHPGTVTVGGKNPVHLFQGDQYTLSLHPDLKSDLASRDLTINALALDEDDRIVAHSLALDDLDKKILRPVSEANFLADPVRAVRAARFSAQFPDFDLHQDTLWAMRSVAGKGLLESIAAERVGQEVLKSLATPEPGRFVRVLEQGNCLEPWLTELDGARSIPAGPRPRHDESLLEHTARVMDRLAGDPLSVWMGLCHDLGKARTNPKLWPRHHGHDAEGHEPAESLALRLRLPKVFLRAGRLAAVLHMKAARYPELRCGTRVDLLDLLNGPDDLRRLAALVVADNGPDIVADMARDWDLIRSVHLPPESQNLGAESGRILRELQAQALARGQRP